MSKIIKLTKQKNCLSIATSDLTAVKNEKIYEKKSPAFDQ